VTLFFESAETSTKQGGALRSSVDEAFVPLRPQIVSPLDDLQFGRSSQSSRVARATSSSYWGPSEIAVSGPAVEPQEVSSTVELVRTWDCLVMSVSEETFIARIVPLDREGVKEEAEFLLTEVHDEDRELVQPGAPLFWFVGYEQSRGRRLRTSELKMRRLNFATAPTDAWIRRMEEMVLDAGASSPTEG